MVARRADRTLRKMIDLEKPGHFSMKIPGQLSAKINKGMIQQNV
jgi:hypothetical protein